MTFAIVEIDQINRLSWSMGFSARKSDSQMNASTDRLICKTNNWQDKPPIIYTGANGNDAV